MIKDITPLLGKIYQGDCLEFMKQLPDKCVDLIFTSPPYNLIKENSGGGESEKFKSIGRRLPNWYADEMPEDEYQIWQKDILQQAVRICSGSVFYNHKVRYAISRRGTVYHPWDIVKSFPVRTEITWDRLGAQGGNSGRYMLADEKIYQIGAPAHWEGCQGFTNIWRFRPSANNGHVCAFPIELPLRALITTTKEGMIGFDPFMGSGTTAVACERLGRKWFGCELEPKYIEIANKRIDTERQQLKLFP